MRNVKKYFLNIAYMILQHTHYKTRPHRMGYLPIFSHHYTNLDKNGSKCNQFYDHNTK